MCIGGEGETVSRFVVAAEKALKAVMFAKGLKFRFVHDLAVHLTVLEQGGVSLPEEVKSAAILTDYSVEARYPGPYDRPEATVKHPVRVRGEGEAVPRFVVAALGVLVNVRRLDQILLLGG